MKIITKFLIGVFILGSCSRHNENAMYIDFLVKQNLSAKEYVINAFENYDIVILCERDHKEFSQYELFLEIVKDTFFINNVGHIFTEVGVVNMDETINSFLFSEYEDSLTTRKRITSLYREVDYNPYWHCYNYPWFLNQLFKLNQNLNCDDKVMLHPVDTEFDWHKCETVQCYLDFEKNTEARDSIMAENIIKKFEAIQSGPDPGNKALVILNYKHAFLKDHKFLGEPRQNTGRYLADRYKEKVGSIYIMGLGLPEAGIPTVIQNGKWDYFFEETNKTDVGFDLEDSPFGKETFDIIPFDSAQELVFTDMFTGIVYYKPIHEHILKTGWEDYATEDFVPELRRRVRIFDKAMNLEMKEQDIENSIYRNNTVTTSQYFNVNDLRKEIEKWKNGL